MEAKIFPRSQHPPFCGRRRDAEVMEGPPLTHAHCHERVYSHVYYCYLLNLYCPTTDTIPLSYGSKLAFKKCTPYARHYVKRNISPQQMEVVAQPLLTPYIHNIAGKGRHGRTCQNGTCARCFQSALQLQWRRARVAQRNPQRSHRLQPPVFQGKHSSHD
jgi:hypothetical protein